MLNCTDTFILSGPEDCYELSNESLGCIIFNCLRKENPKNIVSIDAITGEVLTNEELLEKSIKCAAVFKNLGVEKGDVICIISENTINYVVAIVAALYSGITISFLNPAYSEGELKHGFLISKPKLILSSESAVHTVLKVTDELQFIKTVLLMGPRLEENDYNLKSLEQSLEMVSCNTENYQPEKFDSTKQIAFILLSSGTTGLPKGVMLSHQSLSIVMRHYGDPKYMNVASKDTIGLVLPLFHLYGLYVQLGALFTSTKVVVMKRFVPKTFLETIQQHRVTKLFLVPSLIDFLAKSPLVDSYDLSSVKSIIVTAAAVKKDLLQNAIRRLGGISIQQMYGLTEVNGAATFQTDGSKIGSVGTLLPAVTAKIWKAETNENARPMENGELCFKGPMVMKGYVPAQNCFDSDGFFHTGDVGYYDHDGCFYIAGRMKELIKYKGFQVSPTELEDIIMSHPLVKDCGVIGIPDEKAGEVPLAFVARENGTNISEREIVDFVAERISIQKRLYGGARFLEEIPRNPSGKVLRRKLLEMYHTMP